MCLSCLCPPEQPGGKLEEEVSQSEAAPGPTCGQGVKCAPVSSLPPIPLFFFLFFFTPLGCGLGRWEAQRSEPWAQALTGRRASTALCWADQGRGPFPSPSPQCLLPLETSLVEPCHAPWGPAPKVPGCWGLSFLWDSGGGLSCGWTLLTDG